MTFARNQTIRPTTGMRTVILIIYGIKFFEKAKTNQIIINAVAIQSLRLKMTAHYNLNFSRKDIETCIIA